MPVRGWKVQGDNRAQRVWVCAERCGTLCYGCLKEQSQKKKRPAAAAGADEEPRDEDGEAAPPPQQRPWHTTKAGGGATARAAACAAATAARAAAAAAAGAAAGAPGSAPAASASTPAAAQAATSAQAAAAATSALATAAAAAAAAAADVAAATAATAAPAAVAGTTVAAAPSAPARALSNEQVQVLHKRVEQLEAIATASLGGRRHGNVIGDFATRFAAKDVLNFMADYTHALWVVVGPSSDGHMRSKLVPLTGSLWALKVKKDTTQPGKPAHFVGVTDDDTDVASVLQAVFEQMVAKDSETYKSVAATWALFDVAVATNVEGHMAHVDVMQTHPGTTEELDKLMFIFNAKGKCAAQPWHVDASLNVASTLTLWTFGLPTLLLPYVNDYSFEATLNYVGISEEHWPAATQFAKTHRDADTALSYEVILMDMGPLLSPEFEYCVQQSTTNGISQQPGWAATSRGPWPHAAPGSEGAFRVTLLSTSVPVARLTSDPGLRAPVGYNTAAQHHCAQVCLYFWCFEKAIMYFWRDRRESPDADSHWGSHPKAAAVIRAFLLAAKQWTELRDVDKWAARLAEAWQAEEAEAWPRWVPARVYDAAQAIRDARQARAPTRHGRATNRGRSAGGRAAGRAAAASGGRGSGRTPPWC